MKAAAALSLALSLALPAAQAGAATAYVSDELVLGVYAEQNNQGQRLGTLHSGASVETLEVAGEFTKVQLTDGTIGWVKSAYLTTQEPAIVRVKQLEEELDRSRATTPALAEAAARSEVVQLQRELASKQAELDAARGSAAAPAPATAGASLGTTTSGTATSGAAAAGLAASGTAADAGSAAAALGAESGAAARGSAMTAASAAMLMHPWIWVALLGVALASGFWLGYSVLASRVKRKFGGIKVY